MPCFDRKTSLRGAVCVLPICEKQMGKIYVFLFGLRFPGRRFCDNITDILSFSSYNSIKEKE